MSARRLGLWQRIRGNFAFVPAVALGSGVLAGLAMLALEAPLAAWLAWPPGLMAGPESSRAALTAIATSSLTIAALAVSLTLAVLTYAGAQYSPRVLKTFLAEAVSQVSIGLLLGVHAYCLVVLRGQDGSDEVPEFAAGLGVVAGFVAVALLIYYVHHLASSLRASHVVAAIGDDTGRLLDEEMHAWRVADAGVREPEQRPDRATAASVQHADHPVAAPCSGYLTAIDVDALERQALADAALIVFERTVGSFVAEGEPLARIGGSETPDALAQQVLRCVDIGAHPESEQDAYSGFGQLVDLALRALSPGLNDPHSAGLAIDRLGALLARRARLDQDLEHARARARVFVPRRHTAELMRVCLQPIRQHAAGQCAVLHRLIEALQRIAAAPGIDASTRAALTTEVDALARAIERDVAEAEDAAPLQAEIAQLRASMARSVADPAAAS